MAAKKTKTEEPDVNLTAQTAVPETAGAAEGAEPYESYGDYMDHIFHAVNVAMDQYLSEMKLVYAAGNGGFKNVLYPDLEVAGDLCREKLNRYDLKEKAAKESAQAEDGDAADAADDSGIDDELLALLGEFGAGDEEESTSGSGGSGSGEDASASGMTIADELALIDARAAATIAGSTCPSTI